MPADCVNFQLHLTMNAHGTVWHDGVVLAQVLPAQAGALEARESTAGLAAWPVNALVKVFRDDPPPAVMTMAATGTRPSPPTPSPRGARGGRPRRRGARPAAAVLRIAVARNEYEPLQLAVRSDTALTGVKVVVDAPTRSTGEKLTDIAVAVVGYVPVDHPSGYYQSSAAAWQRKFPVGGGQSDGWAGWWPDPLLPTDTFDLAANQTQPVWITVHVPTETWAGDYTGAVRLVGASGDLKTVPFACTCTTSHCPRRGTCKRSTTCG